MRYENISTDFIDRDFLCFTSNEWDGLITVYGV